MSLDPAGTHINAGLSQANVALLDHTDSERLGDLHHGSSIDAGSQSALPVPTPFRRPSVSNSDSGVDSSEKGDDDDKKGSKKKKHRMGPEQLQILQEHFRRNERLDAETKSFLAEKLKLPPRQIEVWFQNCRVRAKKKKTEERCAYFKEKYQQQLAAQANLEEDNKRLQRDNAQLKRYIRALLVSTASHIPPHILTANLVAANLLPDAGTGSSSISAINTSSMSNTDRLLLEDSLSSLSPNLRAQEPQEHSASSMADRFLLEEELRRIQASAHSTSYYSHMSHMPQLSPLSQQGSMNLASLSGSQLSGLADFTSNMNHP